MRHAEGIIHCPYCGQELHFKVPVDSVARLDSNSVAVRVSSEVRVPHAC